MSEPLSSSPAVEALAEEFLQRRRQGQRPTVAEYVERYPHLADEIRAFFPALELLEEFKPRTGDQTGAAATPVVPGPSAPLEQLGNYPILREIGRGGMGVVYEAEQQSLGRRVALKVLLRPAAQDIKVLERFRRESRAAAQLHHTNIVPVYEVGQQGDLCYYAMQFIRGQALDEVFRELQHLRTGSAAAPAPATEPAQLPAPPSAAALPDRSELSSVASNYRRYCRNVARLGLQAAEALAYAHDRGIVHRDIKPANLLLDTTGVLWVSDFGLVKTQDPALTETGNLVGTLRYMAPERFKGECDARADVYALGLTLYELLVLRPAFDAPDRLHLIEQIGRKEPARLRTLDPRIPRDLETILMKTLEKDPRRRYPTADELAADLRRYLADEPIKARRIGPLERLGRWGRRNPVVAGLSAAVVLVAALGFAGVLGQMQVAWAHAADAEQKGNEAKKERDEVKALNEMLRETQARLRSTLYAAHMNLAQHAWDVGGVERVRELLEQQRPKKDDSDLRGFEWHYLNRLSHAERLVLKGHTHIALSVAYSPDGKRLASCNNKGEFKVWDAQTGQERLAFRGHSGYTQRIVFSPDGQRLASVSFDKTVIVWDAQTGKELITLKGHTRFASGVAFSPDGKRLASSSMHHVQGKRVGEVKVWEAQTGKELLTLDSAAFSVAFSPDGNYLAGGSKVWDAQTGRELFTLKGAAGSVVFSPDSKRLATSCGVNNVEVWDAKTGKELLTIKAHPQEVEGVAFSPDGKHLASASEDRTVKVWDAQTGQELYSLKGHTGGVTSVAFSPDGKHLATAGDVTLRIWDTPVSQNPLVLKQEAGLVACLAFSPDGKHLASGSPNKSGKGPGILKVWDTRIGQELYSLKGHTNGITDVAFSPDGKRIASASYADGKDEGEVKVWEAAAGKELLTLKAGLSSAAEHVAFSPAGKHLASIGRGILKMWDVENGKEVFTVKGVFGKLAFSPEGKRLASPSRVWDAQTGKELLTFKGSTTVAISPDGKRLATAGDDNELKIWDAQTGQELLTLRGHTSEVGGVTFSPDGKRLASVSSDKTVKVWDAQTGQELLTLQGHSGNANGLAFSPDGHRLTAGAADGTVRIWDATPLPGKR